MDEPALTITLASAWPLLAALVVGIGVLLWLFLRHIDGRPLLTFEPRRPVPWTFAGPLLVLVPTAAALLFSASSSAPENVAKAADAPHASDGDANGALPMFFSAAMLLGWAVATCLVIATTFHANRDDFGLPRDVRQMLCDVRLGLLAYFALWPIVYAVQMVASLFLQTPPTLHTLMKEVLEHPSPMTMAAAALLACVTAPITEEIAFRLVFQGWLERREQLSRSTRIVGPLTEQIATDETAENDSPETAAAASMADGPAVEPRSAPIDDSIHWGPILTSATFFGVAHFAQGPPAVAAMVCLGVAQGYIYQRTHRIIPCIACHMMFNSVSMVVFYLAQRAATGP